MFSSKYKSAFTLAFILLIVSTTTVLAVDYNPGLSVGHYVKYGNYAIIPATEIPVDWSKREVTAVSGKDVTLSFSGQFKNGTALPNSGGVGIYNIQAGTLNGTDYTYGIIIAGNLNEGDPIPPLSYGFIVNKTETRTYLGVSRTVNILETTYSDADYDNHWVIVYDKACGIMLEQEFERTDKTPTAEIPYTKQSMSVSETNIFDDTLPSGGEALTLEYGFIALAAVIVVLVVLAVVVFLRKRSK